MTWKQQSGIEALPAELFYCKSVPSLTLWSTLTTYCLHIAFHIKCWTRKSTYLPYVVCSIQIPSHLRCHCFSVSDIFMASPQQHKDHFTRTQWLSFSKRENSNGLQSEKCSVLTANMMYDTVMPTQWHKKIC